MNSPFSKKPFLALLFPLLAGILLQYYLNIYTWSIAFILVGSVAMLYSFMVPPRWQFALRGLFGVGICVFVVGIGVYTTAWRQSQSAYTYSNKLEEHEATVLNMGKEKKQTLCYDLFLPHANKKVIAYIHTDSLRENQLVAGDKILLRAKIQPFINRDRSNKESFDYVTYMHDKGYAGSIYLSNAQWVKTGESHSLKTKALHLRSQILQFYQTLQLSDVAYGILSALTLGYRDELSEEMVQGFRTTGTVHVLSVSGLHVGIIYVAISFLLGFIKRRQRLYKLKPILIIALLWLYAFVTGLSPSVVRASTMLTIYCLSLFFDRKSQGIHALCVTAFFMLLYNSLSVFDIGFQLSFASVLGILYLYPTVLRLTNSKHKLLQNKVFQKGCQLLGISLIAQLATFPICLYYFGTFPTYFFITNLVVVPLVSFIVYAVFGVLVAYVVGLLIPSLVATLLYIPVCIIKGLTFVVAASIHFFEKLPFALLEDIKLNLLELFLLAILIIAIALFVVTRNSKMLTISLISVLCLLVSTAIYIL